MFIRLRKRRKSSFEGDSVNEMALPTKAKQLPKKNHKTAPSLESSWKPDAKTKRRSTNAGNFNSKSRKKREK